MIGVGHHVCCAVVVVDVMSLLCCGGLFAHPLDVVLTRNGILRLRGGESSELSSDWSNHGSRATNLRQAGAKLDGNVVPALKNLPDRREQPRDQDTDAEAFKRKAMSQSVNERYELLERYGPAGVRRLALQEMAMVQAALDGAGATDVDPGNTDALEISEADEFDPDKYRSFEMFPHLFRLPRLGGLISFGARNLEHISSPCFQKDRTLAMPSAVTLGQSRINAVAVGPHQQIIAFEDPAGKQRVLSVSTDQEEPNVLRPPEYLTCPWSEDESIVQVACGAEHTLLLTHTGKVAVCGGNQAGQLGLGDRSWMFDPLTTRSEPAPAAWALPSQLQHLGAVLQIAAGSLHSVVLTQAGVVVGFGSNQHGQLGRGRIESVRGTTEDTPVPMLLSSQVGL